MEGRPDARRAALAVGAGLLLLGLLGFVPGVTTEYGTLTFAGGSEAELFGLFGVTDLHNVVHLALGLAGLGLARTVAGAHAFLRGGGAFAALVGTLSLAGLADVLAGDGAGGGLHLGLGTTMVGLAAPPRFPQRGEKRRGSRSDP